ncbi:MAG TPA: hypothetical protein VGA77_11390 [Propylenella sp.]
MGEVTRLVSVPGGRGASVGGRNGGNHILLDRIKEVRDRADLLRFAMMGAASGNGLDFAADTLLEASHDLAADLWRLSREAGGGDA